MARQKVVSGVIRQVSAEEVLFFGTDQFLQGTFAQGVGEATDMDNRCPFCRLSHHQGSSGGKLVCHANLGDSQSEAKEIWLAA